MKTKYYVVYAIAIYKLHYLDMNLNVYKLRKKNMNRAEARIIYL